MLLLTISIIQLFSNTLAFVSFTPHLLSSKLIKSVSLKSSAKDELISELDGITEESTIYACPKTLNDLKLKKRYYAFSEESYYEENDEGLKYSIKKTPFGDTYIDLTIEEEQSRPLWELTQNEIVGQNFFQNPFISGIYERGYRQNFQNAGFPGIEKEYKEIENFFTTMNSSIVMDLSCGSGFMTRKLVSSNNFDQVYCADLSPTMLAETLQNARVEGVVNNVKAIRADSSRLPLACNSLDAIHAGAAMHCWPRLEEALKEIYRVLKPGGAFYASTFFVSAYSPVGGTNSPGPETNSGFRLFKDEAEIEDLVKDAGFIMDIDDDNNSKGGITVVRKEGRSCAIVKAIKAPLNTMTQQEADEILRFIY